MLHLYVDAPAWFDQALCAQVDTELFFPEKGGSTREAKSVCLNCDVRAQCLDYALGTGEAHGIWGGKSERERRKLANAIPTTDTAPIDVTYDTDTDFTQEIA